MKETKNSNNKCPNCDEYFLVQMDNFTAEFVATRYRCENCKKDFAIHIKDDLDIKKLKETLK